MINMDSLEGRILFAASPLALPGHLVELSSNTTIQPSSIAADLQGNFYIAGLFTGQADFNPTTCKRYMVDGDKESLFLARYSSTGGLYWVTTLKYIDGTTPKINALSVDKKGDLYVAGEFTKAPPARSEAGSWIIPNYDDSIQTISTVWKIDQNGSLTWSNSISRQQNNRYAALHLAVDRLGRVYETGNIVTNPGSDFRVDFEVSRLTADRGKRVWTKSLAGDLPQAIAVDRHDEPWVARQSAGSELLHYSMSGKLEDSIPFATAGSGILAVNSIAFDRDDNIVTSGGIVGAYDFDPGKGKLILGTPQNDDQWSNFFISKITPAHQLVFAQVLGSVGEQDTAFGASVDKSGVIRIAGMMRNAVDFNGRRSGTFVLDSGNQQDLFVASYDAKGRFLSAQNLPRPDSREDIYGSAFAAGRTLVLGMFRPPIVQRDFTLIWEVPNS